MQLLNSNREKVLEIQSLSDIDTDALFATPNFYGIFFFEEAKGQLTIDQQTVALKPYSIAFYYPYQTCLLNALCVGHFIQFHPDFFCIGIDAKDIGCQGVLFNNFYNDLLLSCTKEEFVQLTQFHHRLTQELQLQAIAQYDMVSSLLKIFLIEAVRLKLGQATTTKYVDNQHHRMEKLIDKHYQQESSPNFYAAAMQVSRTQFNRLCHQYFKNSFVNILNLKKIAVAKNELYLTDLPIKAVAYKVGYNDPLYFTRVFKKTCGISPSGFRKQLRNHRLV